MARLLSVNVGRFWPCSTRWQHTHRRAPFGGSMERATAWIIPSPEKCRRAARARQEMFITRGNRVFRESFQVRAPFLTSFSNIVVFS
jgi:hypothetical protein